MLAYKADLYGKEFLTIDPKYTTQRCHACGSIMGQNGYKKLTLKDREWTCPICRMPHIRDWNAAVNIALRSKHPVSSATPYDGGLTPLTGRALSTAPMHCKPTKGSRLRGLASR